MTTLAILKAEMQTDIPRLSADLTALDNKINAAIRYYSRKRFYFNTDLETAEFDLAVGQSRYDSSDEAFIQNIVRIDSLYLVLDDSTPELTRAQPSDIERWLGGSPSNGQPTDYSYENQALRFFAPPDDAYLCRVRGLIKVAAPQTDTEANNPWMTEAYDLIKARASWDLWATTFQGPDGPEAAGYKAQEQEAEQALIDETNERSGTGELIPTEF